MLILFDKYKITPLVTHLSYLTIPWYGITVVDDRYFEAAEQLLGGEVCLFIRIKPFNKKPGECTPVGYLCE